MLNEIQSALFEKEPVGAYLNNLTERREYSYRDNNFLEEDIDKDIEEIAKSFVDEFKNLKFGKEEESGSHFFLYYPEERLTKFGNLRIGVCPYKGDYYGPLVDSNYLWSRHEDHAMLFVDIYDTEAKGAAFVYLRIVQEIYNFMRDAQWVVDGVYEEEMQKMEESIDTEIEDIFKGNIS